jgi:hypothetical protein
MTTYEFSDGSFIIKDVDREFFSQSKEKIVKKILEGFCEDRKYQYPQKQYAVYPKSANVRTQCRCNFYRLKCTLSDFNYAAETMTVIVHKKLNTNCTCDIRVQQLRGEARNHIKQQLRVQEVSQLDNQHTAEVLQGSRSLQVVYFDIF